MHYKSYGDSDSPALVFLHGFLGDRSQFEFLIDSFSKDYRVVLIDLPGCGVEAEDLSEDLSFESLTAELSDFLKGLDLNQPILIGYSLGARLGLYVHLKQNYKFHALFLESLNPGVSDPQQKIMRAEKDQKLSDKILSDSYEDFLSAWYSADLFTDLSKEELMLSALKYNPKNQALILKNLSPGRMPSMWEDLKIIDVPVCLLTGELDSKFTEFSKQALRFIPNARHEIVSGAGHNVHLSKSSHYLKLLTKFIQS